MNNGSDVERSGEVTRKQAFPANPEAIQRGQGTLDHYGKPSDNLGVNVCKTLRRQGVGTLKLYNQVAAFII
jgi:hypothetical protein